MGRYAWYTDTSVKTINIETTHPVGQKHHNTWGVHDIQGNVDEWCLDWYASGYPKGTSMNPKGPVSGTARVVRGGCSGSLDPDEFRSAARYANIPDNAGNQGFGLRVVLEF